MAGSKLTNNRGLSDGRTIEVPLEAFALMMAYSHVSCSDVPGHILANPAYPAHHDGKSGHLHAALRPSVDEAFRLLANPKRRAAAQQKEEGR